MLFSSEHIFFINYLFKYIKAKNVNNYAVFKISEVNTNHLSTYEIWNSTNEIRAYKKIYILIAKNNKISFKSILITLLIIAGDIPLKIINISKYLLLGEGDLKDSLTQLYSSLYFDVKNLKIEIINKKVYINCCTRNDIILKIVKINPFLKEKEILIIYKKLINLNIKYKEEIDRYREFTSPTSFVLGTLKTEEGINIKKAHYSKELKTDFDYKGKNHSKTLIHATSNVPDKLSNSQFSTIAMKNFQKEKSSNNGTIITCGNYEFKQISSALRYVPQWQVFRIIYEVSLKPNVNHRDLFIERDSKFSEILNADLNNKKHREIVQSFGNRNNDIILDADIDALDDEILNFIKLFKKYNDN